MSYQVIARKHRPRQFDQVVGQRHVMQTLENAIRQNRVAHAYIFSGARGVGKTTTARILAKALNCKDGPTTKPCDACDACREITAGTSLDVIEIDAASNRGIDEVRELREMVRYAPAGGRSKVVILDEAHQLTREASNALLKTLEEPPDKVVFVMATTQPEDLADTIRSRAQHFHFRALTFDEISGALEKIVAAEGLRVETGALTVMARAAEGSLRDAESLLEQAIAFCGTEISDAKVRELLGVVPEELLDTLMAAIAVKSAEKALVLAHTLIAEGQNLQHFCREAIRHVRNLLVARVCGGSSALIAAPADERPRLARTAAQFSEEDLTRYFQILLATEDSLRHKMDPRLHLEMGLLKLVNASRLAPLETVLAELQGRGQGASMVQGKTMSSAPAGARAASAGQPMGFAPQAAYATATAMEMAPAAGAHPRPADRECMESAKPQPITAANVPPAKVVARPAGEPGGIEAVQVEALRAAILEQNKFLWSLIEPVTRWEVEGGEMRLYFASENRSLAEMLQSRDPMEKLRTISSRVLGQPLRVCVRLEAGPGSAAQTPAEMRAQFDQDPIVQEMLRRFGGRITEVKRRSEG